MRKKHLRYLSYHITYIGITLGLLILALIVSLLFLPFDYEVMVLASLIASFIFFSIVYWAYKWVYIPYRANVKLLELFAEGYTLQGFYDLRYLISPSMEKAIQKLKDTLSTNEFINANKRQAQYLALQNQINPHFLYNTLEGIRSEALSSGLSNVADMAEALARFFRYTISNAENLVTLEDEFTNIKNYFFIQQFRFGQRIQLNISYDDPLDQEKLLKFRLPKLTLQPVVENAIIHGLEGKVGNGTVNIKVTATKSRLLITISDDGIGIHQNQFQDLTEKLNVASLDYIKPDGMQGGIALTNVNNRIKLLFGEEYGINIYSTYEMGTDVEISLPLIQVNTPFPSEVI